MMAAGGRRPGSRRRPAIVARPRASARPPGRWSTGSATGCAGRPASALCLIAVAIVLFMLVKGISYLRPSLFVKSPAPSLHQSQSGGFLRPDRWGR